MTSEFLPQFHKKLTQNESHAVWVALPHPRSVIPAKINFYRDWQREERMQLENAGDVVLALAIAH